MRRRSADRQSGESGFTLLDMVCVLAIVAMLAAIVVAAFPRHTSRARLEAYAVEAATLLKSDRNAAIRRGQQVGVELSASAKTIRSGASGQVLQLPEDVAFDAVLAAQCAGRDAGAMIWFFPSGMSCGGTLSLSRLGATFEIRVAWLTGGVEIVPAKTF
ncbi:prepilin-type N-terminal cleavage/methylation domain-containing protein [Methylocapsa acidiphila]|uniref:prepilin-type N-terminal cleavage/methylation domain-containing protein n=1 Tax=Methylocapsa acidiphila TaxID=133552 RepID=UPI00040843E2|nr:GspH/FimT family pseudopilin [Methylocapsa acidiphila]